MKIYYKKYVISIKSNDDSFYICVEFESENPIDFIKNNLSSIYKHIKNRRLLLEDEELQFYGPFVKMVPGYIIDEYLTSALNDLLNQYKDLL
jgi:hypothetical protein